RMRELTVDWVMWSRSAAPTKLPAATTSRKVRARSIMITHRSYRRSRYEPRRFVVCQTTDLDLAHGCLFGVGPRRPARATPGAAHLPRAAEPVSGARAGRSFANAAAMVAISRVPVRTASSGSAARFVQGHGNGDRPTRPPLSLPSARAAHLGEDAAIPSRQAPSRLCRQ